MRRLLHTLTIALSHLAGGRWTALVQRAGLPPADAYLTCCAAASQPPSCSTAARAGASAASIAARSSPRALVPCSVVNHVAASAAGCDAVARHGSAWVVNTQRSGGARSHTTAAVSEQCPHRCDQEHLHAVHLGSIQPLHESCAYMQQAQEQGLRQQVRCLGRSASAAPEHGGVDTCSRGVTRSCLARARATAGDTPRLTPTNMPAPQRQATPARTPADAASPER